MKDPFFPLYGATDDDIARWGYEHPVEFGCLVGRSYERFADGTQIVHTWDTGVKHGGWKGWPTHPKPEAA